MKLEKNKDQLKNLGHLSAYLNTGLTMAFSLLLWLGIGYFLDKKLNTTPWFFAAGVSLGLLSVFYELYKLIKISIKQEKEEKKQNENK